jgi:5'-nucleotidase
MTRTLRYALCLAAALLALPASAGAAPRDVDVQLLALNDFHGNLELDPANTIRIRSSDPSSAAVPAGGAARLAYELEQARTGHANTLTVSAGDLIGASPLTSGLFHDEPTIEAMNAMGLSLNAVGNHEFDEGSAELKRMQNGGCHADGCYDGVDADSDPDGFAGADFRFLAANVVVEATGDTLFPPYSIKKFGNIKVGFIGLTLEGTPEIVTAAGVAGLQFLDEADTINRYAQELREEHGVRAIVVLLHQGGAQAGSATNPFTVNDCLNFSGDVLDILNRSTDAVDLFITGHTHQAYNCRIDGRPVTSASSFGRVYTDIEGTLSRTSKDFTEISADNRIVRQKDPAGNDLPQDEGIAALVAHYKNLAAPLATQVIGRLSTAAPKGPAASFPSGELPAGDLIADAQQDSASKAGTGSVAAFMNPGGVRGPDLGFPAGDITYERAFTIQPFANILVTMDLTGEQVAEMLKEQWCGSSSARVLQPSASVHYTYSASGAAAIQGKPCAGAVSPVSGLTIGGAPVDPAATYRLTVNNILAGGGDTSPVLKQGTNRVFGAIDLDAVVSYLQPTILGPPLPPVSYGRITLG